jgi:hypothetical protein
MRRSIPAMLGFAALSALGSAQEGDLLSKLQQVEFTRINRVSQLPSQVVAAVTAMSGGRELADPEHLQKPAAGQKSAEGPHLIFAGKSESLWVVHFAVGGPADGYDLAILELDPKGRIKAKLRMVSAERAWSVPNLKNMVRQGAFKASEETPGR